MKKNFITALALTACLTLSFVSTTFAAEANQNPDNTYGFTIDSSEAEGGLFIDSNGVKYAYKDGELIGRVARIKITDTEDGKHVEHDSYYLFNQENMAAEAWTTVTKDGNNVYHKTGAKLGYNWVYTVTAEDFGYSKTTATTDYIRTLGTENHDQLLVCQKYEKF